MLDAALVRFDQANFDDPNREQVNGEQVPSAWIYGRRMSECLAGFRPNSSEALQLAVRAQHLKRWVIPRADYPLGRVGYNQWRQAQAKYHAESAAEILGELGYDSELIARVQFLLQKKRLKQDDETQALEDVACLVFLTYYLEPFVAKHRDNYDQDKLFGIIQKTWRKMSERGHEAALELLPKLPAEMQQILQQALAAAET